MLGLDPFYLANEGKLIAIARKEDAPALLDAMKQDPLGVDAAIVGEVVEDDQCFVQTETAFGGKRVLSWLTGEALPRIC